MKMIFPVITDFDKKLPYFFAGVGCDYEQEKIERPKGHPCFQWIQTRSGVGKLHMHGREYLLKEGMGMLLFPNEPHVYYKAQAEWNVDWIIFEGDGIPEFVKGIMGLGASEVCSVRKQEALALKILQLHDTVAANEPMRNIACSALVYSLLTDILRNATFQMDKPARGNWSKLDAVVSYIHHHYMEGIALEELAELADLTPQYLCTAFKQYTSQTVFQYINMVRISKSKELLVAEINMPIKEIAYKSGFHDVSYFCKVFRKVEGKSPLDFRRLR